MKGFKGFDKDLKCRGYQYAVGDTERYSGTINLCQTGFHFCENPLDTFGYYPPSSSRFAEVEADDISPQTESDSKRVARNLKITAELSLTNLCSLAAKFILDKVDYTAALPTNTGTRSAATNTGTRSAATNTGYQSATTNTGDQSAATNTGDQSATTNTGDQSAATNTGTRSAATNTGYQSAATNTGVEGCAVSLGIEGKAKGSLGCWLTLAEWVDRTDGWHRVDVQTKIIDGRDIKPDTFYSLVAGRFVETL